MGLNEIIKIGDRIKSYRKKLKITQEQMAEKIGLPRSTYAHYENNTREPSSDILIKIADILDCKLYDLISVENHGSSKIDSQAYFLEKYISTLGYAIEKEMENGYLILKSNDGEFEISEMDIEDLKNSSKSFVEYKVHEIIKKSRKIGKE